MSGADAATQMMREAGTPSPSEAIVRRGRNCWRVERADQFSCIQDAADYFRYVREALLAARHTVFILGWDILATIDLQPGTESPEAPTRLNELLAFITQRHRRLRCYILIWDHAALYTLERDPFSRWRFGWRMPRGIRFGFDDHIPLGASHHQKIVVVDDQLAFCGGIDLTGHRWDTSAHRVEEPARTSGGRSYEPYHEVHAMATGPVAAALGTLARDRWRALGERRLPPVRPSTDDLWPSDVAADLTDVEVAVSRTVPAMGEQAAIRECEALFLDSIAQARRSIYMESQYFTNERLGAALAERLREPDGPEVIAVVPQECHGWLERTTMGAFRDGVFRTLIASDAHRRLRLVYPVASRAQHVPTFVHSKVMIVDDALVRIGSANISNRSMGVDSECDLAVDACGDPRISAGIRHIRNRLVAEHLSLSFDVVASWIERAGSLRALIDERETAERTLARVELHAETETPPSEALRAAADPDEPILTGSPVVDLLPPFDVTRGRGPLRTRIVLGLALLAAALSASAALGGRPAFEVFQAALTTVSDSPSSFWIGVGVFLLANLVLIPLELTVVAAGLVFGGVAGAGIALLGSLAAAVAGYGLGRAIGAVEVTRWTSRRSYRSVRQLGAQGVMGVVVLRLASVASAGSVHLLCGAGRVPFATYMAGTVAGLAPAIFALGGLGALLRDALLRPSVWSAGLTLGAALLVVGSAAALRTFLLVRRLSPSVTSHRERVEFG